ncbi:MAG: hypothetical protein R8N23_09420 [Reichenbachiella sp.]|uniref:hypothetical protein n=1 Tax=Reichenbachiella sp. TaxID=2184521 RepID=UPI0029660CA3|nr:hypothetical protein [Reichenbachiella sp.]MDW3210076.1 hypothetical protein [Reichenbachiella sp.]
MNKTQVIETLESLPNEFSTEELMDRLLFIDKIEKGLEDVNNGKSIPLSEVKDRMKSKWSK